MKSKYNFSFTHILLMWSILLFAYFINFFHSLTTGILQSHLISDFNTDINTITQIGSLYFYAYLFMQIPTGLLNDKFGVKKTVFFGLLFTLMGTLCFASAMNIFMLYLGRGLIGIGTATIFVSILKFQINWLKPNILATMTGIASFIGTLGAIFAQTPLAWSVENIGWRNSLYLIAFATFINLILLVLFLKDSPNLQEQNKQIKKDHKISVVKALIKIIFDIRTWPPILLFAGFYGSYVVIVGYSGTSWLKNCYDFSSVEASSYLIICILGSAIGSVLIGMFSDFIKSRKNTMIIFGFFYIIFWAILAYYNDKLSFFYLGLILFGIGFCSATFVVTWASVQELNSKKYGGVAASVVNMGGFIGPIVFPFIFVTCQNTFIDIFSVEAFQASFKIIFYSTLVCYFFSLFTTEPKHINQH